MIELPVIGTADQIPVIEGRKREYAIRPASERLGFASAGIVSVHIRTA